MSRLEPAPLFHHPGMMVDERIIALLTPSCFAPATGSANTGRVICRPPERVVWPVRSIFARSFEQPFRHISPNWLHMNASIFLPVVERSLLLLLLLLLMFERLKIVSSPLTPAAPASILINDEQYRRRRKDNNMVLFFWDSIIRLLLLPSTVTSKPDGQRTAWVL